MEYELGKKLDQIEQTLQILTDYIIQMNEEKQTKTDFKITKKPEEWKHEKTAKC